MSLKDSVRKPCVVRFALLLLPGLVGVAAGAEFGPAQTDPLGVRIHRVRSEMQSEEVPLRVLLPEPRVADERFPVIYVLPVEAQNGTRWGDGLETARRLGLHNTYRVIVVAPSFAKLPWYADHPDDPRLRQESFFVEQIVPFVDRTYPTVARRRGRLLVGFSKSGWGAWSLLLRHPETFERAYAWDAPMTMTEPGKYGSGPIFGTLDNFRRYELVRLLRTDSKPFERATRLILSGYGNFRASHIQMHATLTKLGVRHIYRDSPQRRHHWNSGWLPEAFSLVTRKRQSIGERPIDSLLEQLGHRVPVPRTDKERRDDRDAFASLDLNKDESLSHEEFVEKAVALTVDERKELFGAADRNWDERLTREEYFTLRALTDEAHARFRAMDLDRNGYLVQHEFVSGSMLPGGLALTVFDVLDGEGRNRVSERQFVESWRQWAWSAGDE